MIEKDKNVHSTVSSIAQGKASLDQIVWHFMINARDFWCSTSSVLNGVKEGQCTNNLMPSIKEANEAVPEEELNF